MKFEVNDTFEVSDHHKFRIISITCHVQELNLNKVWTEVRCQWLNSKKYDDSFWTVPIEQLVENWMKGEITK